MVEYENPSIVPAMMVMQKAKHMLVNLLQPVVKDLKVMADAWERPDEYFECNIL